MQQHKGGQTPDLEQGGLNQLRQVLSGSENTTRGIAVIHSK